MDNKVAILSTAAIADTLVAKAKGAGIDIDVVPFISIEYLKDVQAIKDCAEKEINAVFTSSNAVEAVAKQIEGAECMRIFCVGDVTGALVKKHFGDKVLGVAGNAATLAEVILQHPEIKEVTFFCGDIRRDELPDALNNSGVKVNEVVVYKTKLTPQRVEKVYDGMLFFSPSGVESFFSANEATNETVLFAIGNTTGDALKQRATSRVVVTEKPGKELLIDTVIKYYTKEKQA